MKNPFNYRFCLVRNPSKSMASNALRSCDDDSVDQTKAYAQWTNYVNTLQKIPNMEVFVLPGDDDLPDCVFIEDTMLSVPMPNGATKVLISFPGAITRQKEIIEIERFFENNKDNMTGVEVARLQDFNTEARFEGGDCLFTGKEIFVGLSQRSNIDAINVMQDYFAPYPVTGIPIEDLHLKSTMSLLKDSPTTIISSKTKAGKFALNELKKVAKFEYEYAEVTDEDHAANVLFIDKGSEKFLVRQPNNQFFKTASKIDDLTTATVLEVNNSEVHKIDGCLTCCSVFIR